MNTRRARSIVAEGFIVAALIASVRMLVLEPHERNLARARASLAAMNSTIAQAEDLGLADAAGRAIARAAWLDAMSRRSGDAAQLYHTLNRLAREHEVVIERMQPTPAHLSGPAAKGLAGLSCSITAAGEFGAVARFLDAVEREAGFSAASTIRLSPALVDGRQLVQVSVDTTHRAVRLDELRSALAAASEELAEDEE